MMVRDLPMDMDDETVEQLKQRFDRLAKEGTRRDPPDEEDEELEQDA